MGGSILEELFVLDPNKLKEMLEALEEGDTWKGGQRLQQNVLTLAGPVRAVYGIKHGQCEPKPQPVLPENSNCTQMTLMH